MKNKPIAYNPAVVTAFFIQEGLPAPKFEYRFHPDRKWRFDLAWIMAETLRHPEIKVAIEVQGGLWKGGAHARGSGIVKDMEKHNAAVCMGWKILLVQPKELCLVSTANMIATCLDIMPYEK